MELTVYQYNKLQELVKSAEIDYRDIVSVQKLEEKIAEALTAIEKSEEPLTYFKRLA